MEDKKKIILIAEDLENDYSLLSSILNNEYTIMRAINGAETIEMVHKMNIDLIIIDRTIPVITSVEVVRKLRETGCDLPIIGLSDFGSEEDKKIALEIGCNAYIAKPFSPKKLKETVKIFI